MTNNAYGFLEVRGLVAGIEAADAMVKSALVRLVAQLQTNPTLITLVVEGDIGACTAAVDAGYVAALRVGEVVSQKVIGRPENDIRLFFNEPEAASKPASPQYEERSISAYHVQAKKNLKSGRKKGKKA